MQLMMDAKFTGTVLSLSNKHLPDWISSQRINQRDLFEHSDRRMKASQKCNIFTKAVFQILHTNNNKNESVKTCILVY